MERIAQEGRSNSQNEEEEEEDQFEIVLVPDEHDGKTLSALALVLDISLDQLVAFNSMQGYDTVYSGQAVRVRPKHKHKSQIKKSMTKEEDEILQEDEQRPSYYGRAPASARHSIDVLPPKRSVAQKDEKQDQGLFSTILGYIPFWKKKQQDHVPPVIPVQSLDDLDVHLRRGAGFDFRNTKYALTRAETPAEDAEFQFRPAVLRSETENWQKQKKKLDLRLPKRISCAEPSETPVTEDRISNADMLVKYARQHKELASVHVDHKVQLHTGEDGVTTFLSREQVKSIQAELPMQYRSCDWKLVYKAKKHGWSLHSLYAKCGKLPQDQGVILVVQTNRFDTVIGGFSSVPFSVHHKYYGGGTSFVFTFCRDDDEEVKHEKPAGGNIKVYRWTKANEYFVYSTYSALAMGEAAIYLDSSLFHGSTKASRTFGNKRGLLTGSPDFEIQDIEVWTSSS